MLWTNNTQEEVKKSWSNPLCFICFHVCTHIFVFISCCFCGNWYAICLSIICWQLKGKWCKSSQKAKQRHGQQPYTNSCMGHSLAVRHPAEHWTLVLPHTSLHTTPACCNFDCKNPIILIGCEEIEVMSVFNVLCHSGSAERVETL